MPFLAPLIPVIAGIASAGAGVAGAVEGAQAGGRQQKALTQQEQIAAQEMADKQKIFDLLKPFFEQYLGAGSPFLSQIQRAGAEQNAQQFSNAAGNLRGTMATSGLGFGPSGTTAAALGELGTGAAQNASSTFLQNLLANEQMKFQAAQGLNTIGGMAGSSQNQPNVGVTLQPQTLGSSIYGLSQALKGIIGGNTSSPYGTLGGYTPNFPGPTPGTVNTTTIPAPTTLTPPPILPGPNPTQGLGFGPSG